MPKLSELAAAKGPMQEETWKDPRPPLEQRRPGREYPDPRQLQTPAKFAKAPSMDEKLRQMVRQELSRHAGDVGAETFEEADDFDVGDDDEFDPFSPYEEVFDPYPETSTSPAEQNVERSETPAEEADDEPAATPLQTPSSAST